jgi:hypothetical protein
MDSKMECMRVQVDRDPQAEGYFTAYSPSLGRVALRKTRYLEMNPAGAEPANTELIDTPSAAHNQPHNEQHNQPHNQQPTDVFHNNHTAHSDSIGPASKSSTESYPGRSPLPAPANHKTVPATNSMFGAKLQQALHDERK